MMLNSGVLFTGLKFLVRLCTDMNLSEAQDHANKLKKAEKMQKLREDVRQLMIISVCVINVVYEKPHQSPYIDLFWSCGRSVAFGAVCPVAHVQCS